MARIADRILSSSPKSYGMYAKAAALRDRPDLIHLELGQPVHDTPLVIKHATIAAIEAGHVHYSELPGLHVLRAALAEKISTFNRIPAAAADVIVTNGLTQASYAAIMAVVDPGDEVILLDPFYPQHVGKVELAGGTVVTAPLDAANNFAIRADWIEAKITRRTKAIVLVNPANPTGRVYARSELEELAALTIRHDLLVISDEIYEHVTYGAPHVSIAALPGMAERTISLFGFTKAYAMDGWRIGYATAPADILAAMLKITASEVTHVNTFVQHGALAAIQAGTEAMQAMVDDDRRKRDQLVEGLNGLPGVRCAVPEGTIYAFADIRGTGLTSQEAADRLLDEARVVVEAGSFYGPRGEGFLRVCFGSQHPEQITEAVKRMKEFFGKRANAIERDRRVLAG